METFIITENILEITHLDTSEDTVSWIEFVTNSKTNVIYDKLSVGSLTPTSIVLPNDGCYIYYKIKVYNLEHPGVHIDGSWKIENKIIQYNNALYIGESDIDDISNFEANVKPVINYLDVLQYTTLDSTQYSFAIISELEQCAINYKNSKHLGDCDSMDVYKEFLLISWLILKELIQSKQWQEVQDILDTLHTCSDICEQPKICKSCLKNY